jgi:hypothetical protein
MSLDEVAFGEQQQIRLLSTINSQSSILRPAGEQP